MNRNPSITNTAAVVLSLLLFVTVYCIGIGALFISYVIMGDAA